MNVAVAADSAGRFLAIETANTNLGQNALHLVSFPVGGPPSPPLSARPMLGVGGGIYPSLALMPSLLVSTSRVTTGVSTVGLVRANRSPFGSVVDYGAVTSAARKSGRSSLGVGPGSGAPQYLCFTDGDSGTMPPQDQDMLVRQSTFGASWPAPPAPTDPIIEATTGTQDHCQTVTDSAGVQFVAYHDDGPHNGVRVTAGTSLPGTTPGFLGGFAPPVPLVPPQPPDVFDFPTIATTPNILAHEVAAVEKNGNRIGLWSCLQSPGHCSTVVNTALYGLVQQNWSWLGKDPMTGSVGDPKLVLVERAVLPEGPRTYDRFLLVQQGGSAPGARVRLWKWCAGAANWSDVGEMPTPTPPLGGVPWEPYTEMGAYDYASSGTSVFTSVGRTLHAAYIGCHKSSACTTQNDSAFDAIAWTVSADHIRLCP